MDTNELMSRMDNAQKARLVCGKDFWCSARIEELDIPSLNFADGPHGLRVQTRQKDHLGLHASHPSICYPTASALANSWDPRLARRIGKALGKEARWLGVDVLLGPGINLIRNPKGGRNFEYYSEDPYLTGIMAASMIEGIQQSVSSCVKHFALNSQETHRMSVDEIADVQTLWNLYLPAFEIAIQKGKPDWVMSSYNKVNGVYANENAFLLQDVLRQRMGFEGAVVSDWGGSNDVIKGLQAGCSLEMPGTWGWSEKRILEALESGELSQKDLDLRVLEMLEAIEKARIRKTGPQKEPDYKKLDRLAVEAAGKCAVLLKNEYGLLPLENEKILWVGPFEKDFPIQGEGSSKVNCIKTESFYRQLKKSSLHTLGVCKGYDPCSTKPVKGLEKKALDLAARSDVIVFLCCLPAKEQMEGLDRQAACLPENQLSLLEKLSRLGKPVVLADAVAGPIELPKDRYFQALLYTGLAGQGSRQALIDILEGKINPSGHLAQTFALRWMDHPSSGFFPCQGLESYHEERQMVGYRYFSTWNADVRYPFGYGLSYTDFAQYDFTLQKNGVACKVKNIGRYKGSQLLQMYVRRRDGDMEQELRQLKGFARVSLEPGQEKEVFIPFDEYTFRTWLPQENRFVQIKGEYYVDIATDVNTPLCQLSCYLDQGEQKEPVPLMRFARNARPAKTDPMEVPLESLEDTSVWWMKLAIGMLKWLRDSSLERNRPNTLAISLLDMPLKSLHKTSARHVSPKTADFLKNAATAKSQAEDSHQDACPAGLESRKGQEGLC